MFAIFLYLCTKICANFCLFVLFAFYYFSFFSDIINIDGQICGYSRTNESYIQLHIMMTTHYVWP